MKEHPIYRGYLVSEDGRVFSVKQQKSEKGTFRFIFYFDYDNPKELSRSIGSHGYYTVSICHDKKQITKTVHSLVAEIYLENPDNLPQVNHIDKNRLNNHIDNLEWVTPQKNAEHSLSKKYTIENIKTGEIFTITNMRRWCRDNKVNLANMRATINGERMQCQGYKVIKKWEKE